MYCPEYRGSNQKADGRRGNIVVCSIQKGSHALCGAHAALCCNAELKIGCVFQRLWLLYINVCRGQFKGEVILRYPYVRS